MRTRRGGERRHRVQLVDAGQALGLCRGPAARRDHVHAEGLGPLARPQPGTAQPHAEERRPGELAGGVLAALAPRADLLAGEVERQLPAGVAPSRAA
jgi:hypothetical protein